MENENRYYNILTSGRLQEKLRLYDELPFTPLKSGARSLVTDEDNDTKYQ